MSTRKQPCWVRVCLNNSYCWSNSAWGFTVLLSGQMPTLQTLAGCINSKYTSSLDKCKVSKKIGAGQEAQRRATRNHTTSNQLPLAC